MARDLRRDVHFRARYRQRDDASFSEQSIETMFLNYEVVVEMICEWNGASVFFESGAFRDRVQEMTIVYERVAHALEHGEVCVHELFVCLFAFFCSLRYMLS